MSWIPVLSQLKSAVQALSGDKEGARETQLEFIRRCIIVCQVTSLVYAIKGDDETAKNIQIEFLQTLGNVIDGIPAAGHLKGGIHYACGDKNGGDMAMKSASRSIGKF